MSNTQKPPALVGQVEPSVGRQRTELDVAYFSQRTGDARKFSHQYREAWELEGLFCPKCGQKHVWRCDNGGDYYVGEQYICTACRSSFYLPRGVQDAAGEQNEQRLLTLTPNIRSKPAKLGLSE
jgi:hypothetical protein